MTDPESKYKKEFAVRFERHYDELKWLYCELYDNDEQAFDYFCSMLYEYYLQRKPALRALDKKREADPDWYKNNAMLGILMYTN